jgi:hypothetical protein
MTTVTPPNNTNTPPAGITGNTAALQGQATTGRNTAMNKQLKLAVNVSLGAAFIFVGMLLVQADLGFAINLIVVGAMLYGANKLTKIKNSAIQPWATVLRFGGIITLATILLFSSFGQWTIKTVNEAEAEVAKAVEKKGLAPASEAMMASNNTVIAAPAEGLLVTIEPGTKVISFTVPKDTIGFRNYIPTASVDDINRGSWMDYLVQGPRTGDRESLIVKPGLTEAITVMVDPFTATEQLDEAMTSSATT